MKRREIRKMAVQTLYQIDLAKHDWRQALENVFGSDEVPPFAEQLVFGVVKHQEEIDRLIEESLINWRLERLSRVDHAILRLAVFELRYLQETPVSVVINEAVELGKFFGTEQSGKFINGVLARLVPEEKADDGIRN